MEGKELNDPARRQLFNLFYKHDYLSEDDAKVLRIKQRRATAIKAILDSIDA